MRYSSKKSGPAFGRKARMAQDGNGIRFPRSAENPRFRNLEKADEERRYRQMRNGARGESDILRELREAPSRVIPEWNDEDFENQRYGKGKCYLKFFLTKELLFLFSFI